MTARCCIGGEHASALASISVAFAAASANSAAGVPVHPGSLLAV